MEKEKNEIEWTDKDRIEHLECQVCELRCELEKYEIAMSDVKATAYGLASEILRDILIDVSSIPEVYSRVCDVIDELSDRPDVEAIANMLEDL